MIQMGLIIERARRQGLNKYDVAYVHANVCGQYSLFNYFGLSIIVPLISA